MWQCQPAESVNPGFCTRGNCPVERCDTQPVATCAWSPAQSAEVCFRSANDCEAMEVYGGLKGCHPVKADAPPTPR
jgi:hypothetical protein